MILENIHSPGDLRALNREQTQLLCEELRSFLVRSVSKTGGHLASNLGAVELTVAIHRVFDTAKDRLVFDVGHQCYVHKILTGRMDAFPTLRKLDGLSGFPKPSESVHDAFVAGHASNSISVALGMARARTIQKEHYSVLALLGDGALSGGLAYEGLNNAGASGEPMIVILNDNGMSINGNVGAISKALARLRAHPGYYSFKRAYRGTLGVTGLGRFLYRTSHSIKKAIKKILYPDASIVEKMGFTYLGPVDGHNVQKLENALRVAKEENRPVFLHVYTKKGKGYRPAEKKPDLYHGVPPFDPEKGLPDSVGTSFSAVFGETLCELAADDPRICAITAAMGEGTGLREFASRFPERFFDVGIAEGHAGAMAAGLAAGGASPVFAVYSTFLQRSYDQMIHDVALSNLPVVFAVDRAGLVGADGETHHGIFDATFLSDIPNFTVLCPSDYAELRSMLRRALSERKGPVAIRYPRGGEGAFREDRSEGNVVELRAGDDVTLCAYGTMINEILAAAELLEQDGVAASVLKINCISPFFNADLRKLGKTKLLLMAEECSGVGCPGQRMTAILAEDGIAPERVILKNLGRAFPQQGSCEELRRQFGLDAASIAAAVREVLHEQ